MKFDDEVKKQLDAVVGKSYEPPKRWSATLTKWLAAAVLAVATSATIIAENTHRVRESLRHVMIHKPDVFQRLGAGWYALTDWPHAMTPFLSTRAPPSRPDRLPSNPRSLPSRCHR